MRRFAQAASRRPSATLLALVLLSGCAGEDFDPPNYFVPGQLVPLDGGWCDRLVRQSRCDDGRCLRVNCYDQVIDTSLDPRDQPCPLQVFADLDAVLSLERDLRLEYAPLDECPLDGRFRSRYLHYFILGVWPRSPYGALDYFRYCDGDQDIPDRQNRWHVAVLSSCQRNF